MRQIRPSNTPPCLPSTASEVEWSPSFGRQTRASVLAGGGLNTGQVIGKTDEVASNIQTEAYEPKDLHTTIAYALGLPVEKRIHAMGGRPFFVGNRGKIIREAFGSA